MALTPDATAETVPGYVSDGAGNWFRIGVGAHTHADYLPLAGGTVGPGQLNVPAPVSLIGAARWADGIPRFATVAERDSAYLGIGGAQAGMQCYVADVHEQQRYDGAAWTWVATDGGSVIQFGLNADVVVTYTTNIGPVKWNATKIAGPNLGVSYDSTGKIITPPNTRWAATLMVAITNQAANDYFALSISTASGSMSNYGHYFYGATGALPINKSQAGTAALTFNGGIPQYGVLLSGPDTTPQVKIVATGTLFTLRRVA